MFWEKIIKTALKSGAPNIEVHLEKISANTADFVGHYLEFAKAADLSRFELSGTYEEVKKSTRAGI